VAEQDWTERASDPAPPPAGARRKSITRWVEVAGAAAVMVVGAGWLLLPSAGERVDSTAASPAANVSPAPGPDDHSHGGKVFPKGYVGPTLSPPLELSSPEPTPTGPAPASRYLAAMRPSAGASNVRSAPGAKAGNTVTMPCAAGRDRDLYREARYRLRGDYGRLTARIVNQGDPKASTRLQFLGGDGMIFNKPLAANIPVNVTLDLADSQYLRIRVYCTSSAASIVLAEARVMR